MATQIVLYKTVDKVIQGAITDNGGAYVWDNEATYLADAFVEVDSIKRINGLHADVEALDFTGTLPSDFLESLFGDYTDVDPANWIEPTPDKYKFDGTFANIVANI